MNTVIRLRPSQSEKPTVRGGRAKNTDYRQREYLTEAEIARVATAGNSRNPVRDRLLIMMAFRHALRVSELVDIRWQQIHLDTATVDIRRAKNGTPGIHGLQGDELRLLRALRREHPHADFVFLSERKAPLSVDGAQKIIERLGVAAKLPFKIHAHMLRHADRSLGYTELSTTRFKDFWRDWRLFARRFLCSCEHGVGSREPFLSG
jgi:integrase